MPTTPDSTTPPHEDEPLDEADLPAWTSRRRTLDPLDPEATSTTTPPRILADPRDPPWNPTPATDAEAIDELRNLVDDLEPPAEDETATARRGRPNLSNRVRSILAPRSEGDPRVAAVVGGLLSTLAGVSSLALDATVGRRSGAYVMRPDEAEAIGTPLGRIAARRVNVGDADPTDIGDAIEAAGAAVMYGARARLEHKALTTSTYIPQDQSSPPASDPSPPQPDPGAGGNLVDYMEPPQ